jgi:hypothetical protein
MRRIFLCAITCGLVSACAIGADEGSTGIFGPGDPGGADGGSTADAGDTGTPGHDGGEDGDAGTGSEPGGADGGDTGADTGSSTGDGVGTVPDTGDDATTGGDTGGDTDTGGATDTGTDPGGASGTGAAPFGVNLLVNPGGETGDMSGWNVTGNGGNGWTAASSAEVHGGSYEFATSYGTCSRSQTVDLVAAGFSPAELDAGPDVMVSEWFRERYEGPDDYSITVELQDASFGIIDTWTQAGSTTGGATYVDDIWFELSHTFTAYGSGLRYIHFEDSGSDSEFWSGHYGTRMDDAHVSLVE